MIGLVVGSSTSVDLSAIFNVAGASSIKVKDKAANLSCVDRFVVGDIFKRHINVTSKDPA
jgi:hypothetical protein